MTSSNKIEYLVGGKNYENKNMLPYNSKVLDLIIDFSKELNLNKKTEKYPDIKTLAFFCRKANIYKLKERFVSNETRLGLGLTGDAIDLEIDAEGRLVQLKPALGGNVLAPILSKTLPNLATMRPGLLTPMVPEPGASAALDALTPSHFQGTDIKLLEEYLEEDPGGVALAQAPVVMGIGMGIEGVESLPQIRAMASSVGATLATTRNVVHSGWLPHQIQVGISGRAIAPKVYVAVGIRGAFNHTVGIQKAGVIIAVNQNRRAAIFRAADYGIVGDWKEYLPPLIEALKPVLAQVAQTQGSLGGFPRRGP